MWLRSALGSPIKCQYSFGVGGHVQVYSEPRPRSDMTSEWLLTAYRWLQLSASAQPIHNSKRPSILGANCKARHVHFDRWVLRSSYVR